MKRRSDKTKVPEKVLERAKSALPPPALAASTVAPKASSEKPRHEVKEKLVARLKRFHPMD